MKKNWFIITLVCVTVLVVINGIVSDNKEQKRKEKEFAAFLKSEPVDTVWRGSPSSQIPYYSDPKGKLIYYGYQLISNTSYYLGPKGIVAHVTNGMNCQNCHLDAGTRPFGNNFGKVLPTYPQFRARNNGVQTVYQRINDCMQRSMNGRSLDSNSTEMKAIYAYIQWLDKDIPKNVKYGGTSLKKLPYMDSAANIVSGKQVYITKCQMCHGADGQGQLNIDETGYAYPPLWGKHSYNDGAGMYRLTNIAAFVMANMPYGTDYHHPALTAEEAWDVGAYINSQPRPHLDQSADWKNILKKPFDFPFGPYADNFSEAQHKYGPYPTVIKADKALQKASAKK
ncbi:cytochrome C [Arachidicoccus ginsenosidimutans]|uniref:c-type cytochrome n=1 Tax=Arachidicoccus sp. BS20 TaxID=1850526 RepID=UPI0007F076EE|nr:c-type cytochrome [Arachidicoccus sp. BS20]ANI89281.1 cytochrome C [Arachidicoccus sp. BS20]